MTKLVSALVVASLVSIASVRAAEPAGVVPGVVPEDVTAESVLAQEAAKEEGWVPKLSLGTTGSTNHSQNVVGTPDGATIQLGMILEGSASFTAGQHRWENILQIRETLSRTPVIDTFLKSADEAMLKTTYTYSLPAIDWLGPYARARGTTQLFHGYDVRAGAVEILREKTDGTAPVQMTKAPETRIALTRPFEPLFLRQSAGLFANPLTEDYLTAKIKVGVGIQEILARGGFALNDNPETPVIEYLQLQSTTQGGGELDLALNGGFAENITWEASTGLFYPFYTSIEDAPTGWDAMSVEVGAKVSARLSKWLSLDYVLMAKRIPLILDSWQVQNGVILTAGFDLI